MKRGFDPATGKGDRAPSPLMGEGWEGSDRTAY